MMMLCNVGVLKCIFGVVLIVIIYVLIDVNCVYLVESFLVEVEM